MSSGTFKPRPASPRPGGRILRHVRVLPALAVLALLAAGLPPPAAAAACERPLHLPAVGTVCPAPGGLFEVLAPDGRSLGTTHGADPIDAPDGPDVLAAARAPLCVSASDPYHVVVVYAYASDDADEYAARVAGIRSLVNNANGLVHDAAVATGDAADLRVECNGGTVTVKKERLATRKADASFSTIVSDLEALGYTDGRKKYWVFYDDPICTCGVGHVAGDDRPDAANANNGNYPAPFFAVTFGQISSTRIWLHELGHNLGAVQNSAPRSTGAFHCIDGRDTMCYDDGGPNGGSYTTTACATEVFDCGKNDYFHAEPAPGSYLATHWNLASRHNRYLQLYEPDVDLLTCPATAVKGIAATCSVRAVDDSSGVYFLLDWGDGSSTRHPATGTVAPGTTVSAGHTWTATGARTVTATATDSGGRVSTPRTVSVNVITDATPPTLTLLDPAPGYLYDGCLRVPILLQRAAFHDEGCMRAAVSDAGSGVKHVQVYWGGTLVGTLSAAPWELTFPTGGAAIQRPLRVVAEDHAGNVREVTVNVDALR